MAGGTRQAKLRWDCHVETWPAVSECARPTQTDKVAYTIGGRPGRLILLTRFFYFFDEILT